jgi:flavin-dependent dehydrogenase
VKVAFKKNENIIALQDISTMTSEMSSSLVIIGGGLVGLYAASTAKTLVPSIRVHIIEEGRSIQGHDTIAYSSGVDSLSANTHVESVEMHGGKVKVVMRRYGQVQEVWYDKVIDTRVKSKL